MGHGKSRIGLLTSEKPGATEPAPDAELQGYLASFLRHLRAEGKATGTLHSYEDSVRTATAYWVAQGMPLRAAHVRREHVESFILDQRELGRAASTIRTRFAGLKVFFNWLLAEGEITANPMARMKAPPLPEVPPPVLTTAQIKALLKAGEGKSFKDRRDLAIIRLLLDTGMRRSELAGLTLADVDLDERLATVQGKGNRIRHCPFGAKTAQALDRYLRLRAGHRHAYLPNFWLSQLGALSGEGIRHLVQERAKQAKLARHVWIHLFRHTAASTWLEVGGREGDAMRLMGWKSVQVMRKYGASEADRRAIAAYRELSPGDRF